MLMYSWSSSPHPATFLSRSFRPSKSAAWKTSTQLWYWQRGAYVYFAVHVEVEELVEEVGELLHLEGWEEPLQLRKVGDVVRPLGPIVGSDHRAHLAAAFTALPPTATGGRLGSPAECVVQNTDGRAWLQARGGESTYNTADTCINTNTKIQKYKYNHTKIKIQKYKYKNTKTQYSRHMYKGLPFLRVAPNQNSCSTGFSNDVRALPPPYIPAAWSLGRGPKVKNGRINK